MISRLTRLGATILCALALTGASSQAQESDWISLFDGVSLDGWKASENQGTFSVEDSTIKVAGPRSHLFYMGEVANHDFTNFEFQADVKTLPGSNSGIYFHTEYQEEDWPAKGYEVQVNNSHTDWKRTAGLYDIQDVREPAAKDNEWFNERILVEGKRIRTFVNDSLIVDFTEPEDYTPPANHVQRVLSSGTFALQGHDPDSVVYFKNVKVRVLE